MSRSKLPELILQKNWMDLKRDLRDLEGTSILEMLIQLHMSITCAANCVYWSWRVSSTNKELDFCTCFPGIAAQTIVKCSDMFSLAALLPARLRSTPNGVAAGFGLEVSLGSASTSPNSVMIQEKAFM